MNGIHCIQDKFYGVCVYIKKQKLIVWNCIIYIGILSFAVLVLLMFEIAGENLETNKSMYLNLMKKKI